jgi:hypothetical protein
MPHVGTVLFPILHHALGFGRAGRKRNEGTFCLGEGRSQPVLN